MATVDPSTDAEFAGWLEVLERRQLADLDFSEVRRGLQALSARYVERRRRAGGVDAAALDGAGKRAAFALYYAPLHFLVVRRIVDELDAAARPPARLVDLGCGTGAAGAAWALGTGPSRPTILGVDRNAWALAEARRTWRQFGLSGRARRAELSAVRLPGRGGAILAAWVVNELEPATRDALLARLTHAVERGARLLVVEAIARRPVPWWDAWADVLRRRGGRSDTWRFPVRLPPLLARLDRAAGLRHDELSARSLWAPGVARR